MHPSPPPPRSPFPVAPRHRATLFRSYVRALLEGRAALLHDRTPAERLVLIALAAFAGPHGTCSPTVARIAEWTGLTQPMVRRATRALAHGRLLDIVATNGGRNIYAVRVDTVGAAWVSE
ncbi:helix-turn-helix domain-containing protein [Myxococcota bacterium]|nr:helix-turn-helix domain-containing protein [Myxococcota bacterium]